MMIETATSSQNSVGPVKWKRNSYNKIRKVHQQIENIENASWNPQYMDETLVHKEIFAGLSNQEALKYSRSVRKIVSCLQESIVQNNEEIKKLNSLKLNYEKYLYNIKVDQKINRETQVIRNKRPEIERKIIDGADDLLVVEKTQLLNIRFHLEMTLKSIQEHLLNINESRKELIAIQKERNRVLDLLCPRGASIYDSRLSSRISSSHMISRSTESVNLENFHSDPLSAYTPACKNALRTASNVRNDSQKFRDQISNKLEKIQNYRNTSSQIVNSSFIHKLTETEQLKNQLQQARIRARSATNKAQRWYNHAEKTMEFNQGPLKYQDLLVRERLDRPIIKIYQRHPGTQVAEAQDLIHVDNKLRSSMIRATENLGNLRAMDVELYKDIQLKSQAMEVDKTALRWRRYKSQEMHCK